MHHKKKLAATNIKSLSRRILIAFILFVIALVIAALFVNNSISRQLADLSKQTSGIEYDEVKSQRALLLLHEAEDDFQESLLTANSPKTESYKTKLSQSFNLIDSLLKDNIDTTKLSAAQRIKVRYLYLKKLKLSDNLYILKYSFDSLLKKPLSADTLNNSLTLNAPPIRKEKVTNSSDTVKSAAKVSKKGLFARIKDAITNKNASPAAGVTVISYTHSKRIIDSLNKATVNRNKNFYSKKLQQLQQRNSKLFATQKEMILLNTHINNELERIVNDIKNINLNIINELKENALKSYRDTTALLNKFYLGSLSIVLIFATLLIVFIINLNRAEAYLLRENQRSVAIAQQKMDLLLHMSHEVRNPLTAINGFLYIFSRSNLSARQIDMLSSIRLSSDMLLHTLNDTLDAAKMETNTFKINSDPFNPNTVLKEVIESMEFSATKKQLSLEYYFDGDKEAMILGDSFRLKQIMVNLLSNAVKYTKQGGITIKAQLVQSGEENKLQIKIIDTGAGISTEQQAKLFSKYYQSNSAKGQVGTGLGLYICKQLIQLQNGAINVESDEKTGSTFSFFIPYKNYLPAQSEQATNNPVWKLNGISILAVDSNELSLIFLKMMTDKWNVKFHGALSGDEALQLIAKEPIQIVLADLNLPGMNAAELVANIKSLKVSLNKLPVIVISNDGLPSERERYLEQGFAGVLVKPFIEAELIKQIILALGL
ncbi:hybrid sensor histidine kinase/response regulator [Mucilaginibacter aquariorum]|uniref:histidine kinase n=1 Tax=Mucilaginibacter aquariorum TaxID=2967225 RepID=A0ABT1SZG0_9SPHI|nr:ATP-binding protein [Mucilaginibacter aquariorum]MCQ6957736.1 ATP-binding protein [Mucilaginibacter aquariorum]